MKTIFYRTTRVAWVCCALLAIVCSLGSPTVASTKGSLKNNVTFWTPMHPVRLCCENSEYPDIRAFSQHSRAPQHPKLRPYLFVNPKEPPIEAAHGSGISFLGSLSDISISEASGIAASRRRTDVLWVINDGGNGPLIYAVGLDGSDYGHVSIRNARNQDWEDLAAFVYNQTAFLLIADCGDNKNRRKSCVLYMIEEPRVGPAGIVEKAPLEMSRRIEYVYTDGPRDCEGVAVDEQRREILLLTKRTEPPVLYSLPLTLNQSDKIQTARLVTKVGGIPKLTAEELREDPLLGHIRSQPTAMDISPDGKIIAVLTYKQPYLFYRQGNESWPRVFARPPISLDMPRMRQAEAMCFSTDGTKLIVTSEKLPAPLYQLDIKP